KVEIEPIAGKLRPLCMLEQGQVTVIKGIAISSHLKERRVSERMREACLKALNKAGYEADIEVINDKSAYQKGAALFAYSLTDKGCLLGSDMAGKLGRTAEEIGKKVARSLIEDIDSGATVDRFTADQLILYAALADGESEYIIPRMTEHVDSNLWLVEEILGAEVSLDNRKLKIRGVGLQ
ncbi:MAG: RNA 3'-terminal phosphate cyclase, partial [Candidatus Omnitrophota bacterium]